MATRKRRESVASKEEWDIDNERKLSYLALRHACEKRSDGITRRIYSAWVFDYAELLLDDPSRNRHLLNILALVDRTVATVENQDDIPGVVSDLILKRVIPSLTEAIEEAGDPKSLQKVKNSDGDIIGEMTLRGIESGIRNFLEQFALSVGKKEILSAAEDVPDPKLDEAVGKAIEKLLKEGPETKQ